MKKKIISIIALIIAIGSMNGCGCSEEPKRILDDGSSIIIVDIAKTEQLVCDYNTKIVYIRQNTYHGYYVYALYLSENGFPYKYDDGKLVEVNPFDVTE